MICWARFLGGFVLGSDVRAKDCYRGLIFSNKPIRWNNPTTQKTSNMPQARRYFTPEFKFEIAKKIVGQQHNIAELCRALELGETAVRRWAAQYRAELSGQPASANR